MILAANIRQRRKERGISQQDFALEIEMDRTYVGGIERIAKGLEVSPDLLLKKPD